MVGDNTDFQQRISKRKQSIMNLVTIFISTQLIVGVFTNHIAANNTCSYEPTWPTRTITWCIDDERINPDPIRNLTASAFREWEQVGLQFIQHNHCVESGFINKTATDIVIIFRFDDKNLFHLVDPHIYAITHKPPFGFILINSSKNLSLWYPALGSTASHLEVKALFSVLLHEIGRAIGLCDHDASDEVMSTRYQYDKFSLHAHDIERAKQNYRSQLNIISSSK